MFSRLGLDLRRCEVECLSIKTAVSRIARTPTAPPARLPPCRPRGVRSRSRCRARSTYRDRRGPAGGEHHVKTDLPVLGLIPVGLGPLGVNIYRELAGEGQARQAVVPAITTPPDDEPSASLSGPLSSPSTSRPRNAQNARHAASGLSTRSGSEPCRRIISRRTSAESRHGMAMSQATNQSEQLVGRRLGGPARIGGRGPIQSRRPSVRKITDDAVFLGQPRRFDRKRAPIVNVR
jgi:hypothetical protein